MEIGQNTTLQVITTTQIIGISGASAIAGSLITLFGIWLKSFLESKENKKIRLFEARRNAYAGLIGHLNNSFAKYDIFVKNYEPETILESITKYSISLDYELADALLLSSNLVKEKIEEYKQKIFSLRGGILSDANSQNLQNTFQNRIQEAIKIQELAKELINMIRSELEIK